MATDCGSWNMKVTLIDGTLAERDGALIKEIFGNDTPISQTIREIIPIEDKEDLNSITNLNEANIKQSYNNTASLIDTTDLISVVESPFE